MSRLVRFNRAETGIILATLRTDARAAKFSRLGAACHRLRRGLRRRGLTDGRAVTIEAGWVPALGRRRYCVRRRDVGVIRRSLDGLELKLWHAPGLRIDTAGVLRAVTRLLDANPGVGRFTIYDRTRKGA
jgi:hypothetical protein